MTDAGRGFAVTLQNNSTPWPPSLVTLGVMETLGFVSSARKFQTKGNVRTEKCKVILCWVLDQLIIASESRNVVILLSPFSPYILIMLYKFYDIKWEMEETTKS